MRQSDSRRNFLKTAGATAAGLYAAGAGAKATAQNTKASAPVIKESLAINGGPKTVTVPFGDAAQWPLYGPEEEKAVLEVVRRPGYDPNFRLERDWQEYYKVPYVRAYCNGTGALNTMFFALNLPPGSEIMVPSYTFFATIVPMRLFGLVPVFVDINPRTLCFDLEDAKRRLTKNTKAIMPVHWIGLPADIDQIADWAEEKGLILLEDACHVHGARLKGKLMGTWGEMAAFSFQATKPLPAIEGGMANYKQREHFERGSTFGHYDLPVKFPADSKYRKYYGCGLGTKLRMHPMAAALARVQLSGLDKRNEMITKQIRGLNDRLAHLPGLYEQGNGRTDVDRIYYAWNMLFIDPKEAGMSREKCVEALRAEGVNATAHSYTLQHKLALYREPEWWHHPPVIPELPGSDKANATGISLPCFSKEVPELIDQYVKAFEKVWAHRDQLV
ncbi:MAG: DegT/DnrJ/EryC1/StrS family aminotransferase [Pirellulales bacterium]|nr:DegT/DnrJ/EryC1/StrS family aminotransferase [Pirellulales bacterium]